MNNVRTISYQIQSHSNPTRNSDKRERTQHLFESQVTRETRLVLWLSKPEKTDDHLVVSAPKKLSDG